MHMPITPLYAKLLNKGNRVPDTFCIDIALRCTELLDEIKRKAKENRNGSFKGNQYTEKEAFVSRDTNSTEPIHTSEQIADISKTSRGRRNFEVS